MLEYALTLTFEQIGVIRRMCEKVFDPNDEDMPMQFEIYEMLGQLQLPIEVTE